MAIQFKVINKGAAAIIPDIISFRLEDTFMDHSSLVFRTAEPQALKFMSKVEVRDGTTPLFMGYISSPNKVDPSSNEPSNYFCSSVSRLLTHRYPVPRTFESGVMIKQLIYDAIGTTGLLADANHRLNEDVWTGPIAPNYTWYMRNMGTSRYAPPASIYLGSTPLTHGASAGRADGKPMVPGCIQVLCMRRCVSVPGQITILLLVELQGYHYQVRHQRI